jgi:hypothetical protein
MASHTNFVAGPELHGIRGSESVCEPAGRVPSGSFSGRGGFALAREKMDAIACPREFSGSFAPTRRWNERATTDRVSGMPCQPDRRMRCAARTDVCDDGGVSRRVARSECTVQFRLPDCVETSRRRKSDSGAGSRRFGALRERIQPCGRVRGLVWPRCSTHRHPPE